MIARSFVLRLALLGALLAAGGCGADTASLSPEMDEPLYREGMQLEREGKIQEALSAYLKLIARRGDQAPESHLEAGLIFLGNIKDPISAIYHFKKFLEVEPNSPKARDVRGQIDNARREFAASLPAQPMENQALRMDLMDQVEKLRLENASLKAEIAALRTGAEAAAANVPVSLVPVTPPQPPPTISTAQSPPSGRPPAAPPSAPRRRTHVIAHGDSLFKLAEQYYGNRSKWKDILAANRDQIPDPQNLRVGVQITLP